MIDTLNQANVGVGWYDNFVARIDDYHKQEQELNNLISEYHEFKDGEYDRDDEASYDQLIQHYELPRDEQRATVENHRMHDFMKTTEYKTFAKMRIELEDNVKERSKKWNDLWKTNMESVCDCIVNSPPLNPNHFGGINYQSSLLEFQENKQLL